jgi:hypothetical protein
VTSVGGVKVVHAHIHIYTNTHIHKYTYTHTHIYAHAIWETSVRSLADCGDNRQTLQGLHETRNTGFAKIVWRSHSKQKDHCPSASKNKQFLRRGRSLFSELLNYNIENAQFSTCNYVEMNEGKKNVTQTVPEVVQT